MKFEPAVYEHAAKLIDKSPWEVSRSKDLIIAGHQTAYNLYHHQPIVVGIDIYNLEVEAYGAQVVEPRGDGIPSFKNHILASATDIINLPEYKLESAGRLAMIIEAGKDLQVANPAAMVKIPVSGAFSLAANIIGLENLLCDAMITPDAVVDALAKLTQDQLKFCRAISDAGLGITFFESAATPPLVPPPMFDEIVLPALKKLIIGAEKYAHKSMACIIGGNTAPILKSILTTGTKYVICPSETDQSAFMEIIKNHPDVMVRINMNPKVFCSEDITLAQAEADRVLAIAANHQNVCLGSGVLPYEANPQTTLAIKEYIEQHR